MVVEVELRSGSSFYEPLKTIIWRNILLGRGCTGTGSCRFFSFYSNFFIAGLSFAARPASTSSA
jgi:hypothetical protein